MTKLTDKEVVCVVHTIEGAFIYSPKIGTFESLEGFKKRTGYKPFKIDKGKLGEIME